jgi:hypothetical protein
MHNLKKVLVPFMLVVAVLATSLTAFAAESKPSPTAELVKTGYMFDNTTKQPLAIVTDGDYVLQAGTDYKITYVNNVEAGTATAIIEGLNKYMGLHKELDYTINARDVHALVNRQATVYVDADAAKVSKVRVGKLKTYIKKQNDFVLVKKETYPYTMSVLSKSKHVNLTSDGVVTVKKGTKPGTYNLKVKFSFGGNKNFNDKVRTLKIKVAPAN